ncbi:MAG: tRNA (adenosine(37)-N6)-threonylcarbamoyltransferase complex ATPase subunit type 1 TsaE [Flammeovirgaceae bacterium]|jgi:tRNA threonylcarbamoyladenosine biosynthesis protein TsaE|nr:tRNA (adenosine(37)-N6)-threonylcarbamoyltransferase complex ATPase subunit type 1 TsaE [Flammeovirgaceae bacterium]|tara:strand:- start:19953 stop:20375 length:423 start_codon:yes stop_codon:yes gene_type:complete
MMMYSLDQIALAVELIYQKMNGQKIICFNGEMGSGKTTLIKEVCRRLGVNEPMNSPTFAIINEYRDLEDLPIYHFDFYRIRNMRDANEIGVEEYFYSGHLCLIEWAENIATILPEQYLEINIKLVANNQRELNYKHHGAR